MHSRNIRGLILAVLGGCGAVGVVIAVFALVRPAGLITGVPGLLPIGWIVPLGSLFVIVGVTWLLLSQAPMDGRSDAAPYDSITCPSCGRQVMIDWRLCPYCGAMMTEAAAPAAGNPAVDETRTVRG